jgi:hypothetical protein
MRQNTGQRQPIVTGGVKKGMTTKKEDKVKVLVAK